MPASPGDLTNRLEQARKEMQDLAEAIRAGEVDPRVLREFRQAVDHLRLTAWAVQQWLELQAQNRDAYSVLPLLTGERIRRATTLNRDLTGELDAMEISFDAEGLKELFDSVNELLARLTPLFHPGEAGGRKRRPPEV
jgi:hypothetical protein